MGAKRFFSGIPGTAVLLAVALSASPLHAGAEDQNRFGANLLFTGLTYHPGGGDHTDAYPRKLDAGAYWVLLLGGEMDLDWYAYHFSHSPMALLVRGSVSLNKDCSDVWGGFFHLGPHFNLALGERFAFRIGVGPTLVWRQNWNGVVANYTGDSFYGETPTNDYFQSKFIWYGGNMELEWKIKPNVSLIFSNIPGWPHIITSSIGARYSF